MKKFTIKTADREIGLGDGVYQIGTQLLKISNGNTYKIWLLDNYATFVFNAVNDVIPSDFQIVNEAVWNEAVTNLIATIQLSKDCQHEFEGENTSACCGATIYSDSDICSDCKEHCEEDRWCKHCGESEMDIDEKKKNN